LSGWSGLADAQGPSLMSLAFVTPSFGPDFERCALLVTSLDRFAPAHPHYLFVDAPDLPRFRTLAGNRTHVIDSREVMDARFVRTPFRGGTWLNWRALPMRGWISQQIRKLASPLVVAEDTLVMIDSDTALIRPFTPDLVAEGDALGLLDVDYCAGMVPKWTAVAADLLGQKHDVPLRGHVGHLVCWHREHVIGLQARIEASTGLPWQVAIARKTTFSEYITYGVYLREVLGYEGSRHRPTDRALVKQPWTFDLTTQAGRTAYFSDFAPENVAVMIHSKDGVPIGEVRRHLAPIFERCA